MKIVTLSDKKYAERVKVSMSWAHRLGYEILVYDVGDLGFGIPYEIDEQIRSLPVRPTAKLCLSKPLIILDALNSMDEMVIFLDADAFVVKPIPELENDDYDIGVTYKGGETHVYLNAGVVFVKNNDAARRFMHQWVSLCKNAAKDVSTIDRPSRLGDNYYLNELVFSHIAKGQRLKNTVQTFDGIRIKFFDQKVYNHFNTVPGVEVEFPDSVKIVHLRHRSETNFHIGAKQGTKQWS